MIARASVVSLYSLTFWPHYPASLSSFIIQLHYPASLSSWMEKRAAFFEDHVDNQDMHSNNRLM
jgi:hypothetical protein